MLVDEDVSEAADPLPVDTRLSRTDLWRRPLDGFTGHLDAAESLQDLRVPPGNRLDRLSGDREGQHSIRIDDQWRLCFGWRDGDAHDVEIFDHH